MTRDRLREFWTGTFTPPKVAFGIYPITAFITRRTRTKSMVFDAIAEFKGESLNRHLLQGPDLTNSLNGVLCHFRKEPIAFTCDVKGMFHQVYDNFALKRTADDFKELAANQPNMSRKISTWMTD